MTLLTPNYSLYLIIVLLDVQVQRKSAIDEFLPIKNSSLQYYPLLLRWKIIKQKLHKFCVKYIWQFVPIFLVYILVLLSCMTLVCCFPFLHDKLLDISFLQGPHDLTLQEIRSLGTTFFGRQLSDPNKIISVDIKVDANDHLLASTLWTLKVMYCEC